MSRKIIALPGVRAHRADSAAQDEHLRVRVARLARLHGEPPPACVGAVTIPEGSAEAATTFRDVARSVIGLYLAMGVIDELREPPTWSDDPMAWELHFAFRDGRDAVGAARAMWALPGALGGLAAGGGAAAGGAGSAAALGTRIGTLIGSTASTKMTSILGSRIASLGTALPVAGALTLGWVLGLKIQEGLERSGWADKLQAGWAKWQLRLLGMGTQVDDQGNHIQSQADRDKLAALQAEGARRRGYRPSKAAAGQGGSTGYPTSLGNLGLESDPRRRRFATGGITAYLDTLEYGGSGPITVGAPDAQTGIRPIGFTPNLVAHALVAGQTPTATWDAVNNRFDFGIPAGAQGADGLPGERGNTIFSGTTNPSRTFGGPPLYQYTTVPAGAKNGDFYLNTATNMLFGPFNDANGEAAWGTGQSLTGPAGPSTLTYTDSQNLTMAGILIKARSGLVDRNFRETGETMMQWGSDAMSDANLSNLAANGGLGALDWTSDILWSKWRDRNQVLVDSHLGEIRRIVANWLEIVIAQDLGAVDAAQPAAPTMGVVVYSLNHFGVGDQDYRTLFNAQVGFTFLHRDSQGNNDNPPWTSGYAYYLAQIELTPMSSARANGYGAGEENKLKISLSKPSGWWFITRARVSGYTTLCGWDGAL